MLLVVYIGKRIWRFLKNEEMSAEDRKKAQADMLKELIAKRFQNRKN